MSDRDTEFERRIAALEHKLRGSAQLNALRVSGNETVAGTLAVTGALAANGGEAVTGDLTATGRIETAHGTWTPAFVGTGTAGTFTYTVQFGSYIKIGKLVWIDFQVHISVVTVAATGNLTITGLPFTSVTAANYHVVIPLAADKVDTLATTVQVTGRIVSSVAVIDFIETGDNINATLLPGGAISAGTTIVGSCCYEAA